MKILILLTVFFLARPGLAYTVRKNDNLWKIAKREYGRGTKWRLIYAANARKIRNPDHIRPGMVLRIPPDGKLEDIVPDGYEYWKTINATVKAYCPRSCCCKPYADGKTALGDNAWVMDGVAVSFNAIPKRTMMYIPGAGWKEADCSGPQPRKKWLEGKYYIEVRMFSHRAGEIWGRKRLKVKLYRRKK